MGRRWFRQKAKNNCFKSVSFFQSLFFPEAGIFRNWKFTSTIHNQVKGCGKYLLQLFYDVIPPTKSVIVVIYGRGSEARGELELNLELSRMFLSDKIVKLITDLLSQEYLVREHIASSKGDYVYDVFPHVRETYDEVLKEAKKDFKNYQFAKSFSKSSS